MAILVSSAPRAPLSGERLSERQRLNGYLAEVRSRRSCSTTPTTAHRQAHQQLSESGNGRFQSVESSKVSENDAGNPLIQPKEFGLELKCVRTSRPTAEGVSKRTALVAGAPQHVEGTRVRGRFPEVQDLPEHAMFRGTG